MHLRSFQPSKRLNVLLWNIKICLVVLSYFQKIWNTPSYSYLWIRLNTLLYVFIAFIRKYPRIRSYLIRSNFPTVNVDLSCITCNVMHNLQLWVSLFGVFKVWSLQTSEKANLYFTSWLGTTIYDLAPRGRLSGYKVLPVLSSWC